MNILFDASSIINLINGKVIDKVFDVQGFSFSISPIVYDETYITDYQKQELDFYIGNNKLCFLDTDVDLEMFLNYRDKLNLGAGEIECLLIAKTNPEYCISCDDKNARRKLKIELGETSITGSLFLLREMVRQGILVCEEAILSFLLMKKKGGFLPNINEEYLCT